MHPGPGRSAITVAIRAAVALGLCALAIAATTPPAAAAGDSGKATATLLVAPFDVFDTAADQRPKIVADQQRWLAAANARLRHDLAHAAHLHVIGAAKAKHVLAATTADYAHPSACPSCLLADARAAGAGAAVAPEFHRISNLILYMRVTIYRVGTPGPVFRQTSEVKADNRTMILRATDSLAQAIETALVGNPQ